MQLRARDMAFALAFSKAGMAAEQLLFSWLLADRARGRLLGAGLLFFLLGCSLLAAALFLVVLPRSGLVRITAGGAR